ncbi:MAG: hypothetical protein KKB34_00095 [Bacteroidetes bacterium]|nr:hypothetical protein [Bacteroidota bacterium]
MDYNEIYITNPITLESVNKLFNEIKLSESEYIIINSGEHNFESIAAIKKFKLLFYSEIDIINRIKKIAFLHPPEIQNISENKELYNFFNDKSEAVSWLRKNEF